MANTKIPLGLLRIIRHMSPTKILHGQIFYFLFLKKKNTIIITFIYQQIQNCFMACFIAALAKPCAAGIIGISTHITTMHANYKTIAKPFMCLPLGAPSFWFWVYFPFSLCLVLLIFLRGE